MLAVAFGKKINLQNAIVNSISSGTICLKLKLTRSLVIFFSLCMVGRGNYCDELFVELYKGLSIPGRSTASFSSKFLIERRTKKFPRRERRFLQSNLSSLFTFFC